MSKVNTEPTPTFSDADIAKARDWFRKGQDLAQQKNYDYAIQCYIGGLDFWPDAVEEAHKPCLAAALFRGGKKIGFTDSMRLKTTGKDLKRCMLNAETLLSMDPKNIAYMEALFRSAAKAHFDQTVMWIGQLYAEAAGREEKFNPARFELMRQVYEELADRRTQDNPGLAAAALERAVDALGRLREAKPTDMGVSTDLRDVASKLTILKGNYETATSFRDSIHDAEHQRDLQDGERAVQSDERTEDLIAKAQARFEAEPRNPAAVLALVDLLCRREEESEEKKAIGLLLRVHKNTGEYRFKMRADDIYMKQLKRRARGIVASGDREAARALLKERLRYELGVFKERCRQYPTDMRLRYEYGVRLFQAGQYDEAIPVLQEARNDPKTRQQCSLHIGRCFFEKGYFTQAIDIFRETIEQYEMPEDELGKELHYWLGRAYEGNKQIPEALKTYGQIIQWDYNYRKGDVRKRIDDLKRPPESPAS